MHRSANITPGVILVAVGMAALLYVTVGKGKSVSYEHTVPLGDSLREIRIDGGSLDLDIRFEAAASGNGAVRIEGRASSGIAKRIRSAKVENGVLNLRFGESGRRGWDFFAFGAMNGRQIVTVEMTEDALAAIESFRASVGSGSLEIRGAAARESVIASDSGSIRIDGLRGDAATVQTDSGSIRLDRFEGGRLSLRSDSGSIRAVSVTADLYADSDSGNIRVEHLSGYGSLRTDSGSIHIVKDDGSSLDVISDSGNVRIAVPAAFSGIYDVQSDAGTVSHPDHAGTSGEVIRVRTASGSIRIEQLQ
ncbi:MAG: hypothetical protein A9Z00_01105 [Thermobacillus sp. ZCTH02-B1]|uniref:DUF4097 family beta strand repeat-containing protein n=1 Tax=Thermobacillus sp. ZCTH02-B1 TaxID=1858795 RepID=UPI000B56A9FB|nr:DUF4097 family beta strand repeat-containing protein [Thermobacillus sp. ZCTH02-B1]OUM94795.1 MAG: hypothetical protein A9Z00_01105 [Thermobacillus sp. ZCTH02-B1]